MRHSRRTIVASSLIGAALAGAFACGRVEPAADVAAEIEGEVVPYAEFEVYLAANAIVDAPSLGADVLSSLFDQFLGERLLTRMAADEGITAQTPRAAVARLIAEAGEPVESSEVEAYFRANSSRFRRAERVRLRQILVEERSTAEAAMRDLAAGAAFEDVARRLSEGPRANQGGDQGILAREDLPPEIAARIFDLEVGEISEIIAAEYGFHIFQISARFPESPMALEAARAEIVEELEEGRRNETTRDLLERAVKRYNVRLFSRNLPFRYQGKYG